MTVIDTGPTAAESASLNVTDWVAPGASENADDGRTVTPFGTFWRATLTVSLNPSSPRIAMTNGDVVEPTCADSDEVESETLKSATGGAVPSPPPQAHNSKTAAISKIE